MSTYLGQNFLIDSNIKSYIAEKIKQIFDKEGFESIIEIGPGRGAITKKIHKICEEFFVIEKDENLVLELKSKIKSGDLRIKEIIHQDVLDFDIKKILLSGVVVGINIQKIFIVGNLPYYITSPILTKFFGNGKQNFGGGFFMIQKEVGDRLDYEAKKKSYLRWLLNYAYEVKYLKTVGPQSFKPAPKVKSCLISILAKDDVPKLDFEKLKIFLDLFNQFSRKTLGASCKILERQGKALDFNLSDKIKKKRLEELGWDDLENII